MDFCMLSDHKPRTKHVIGATTFQGHSRAPATIYLFLQSYPPLPIRPRPPFHTVNSPTLTDPDRPNYLRPSTTDLPLPTNSDSDQCLHPLRRLHPALSMLIPNQIHLPPAGLEPATLALLAPCSNHLSYGGCAISARPLNFHHPVSYTHLTLPTILLV